ncbi:MAG: nitrogenase component 1 [Synergistaceae bacterium]|nr:nitrogenase component 1 [Synergistaceae bacterium]
MRQTCAILSTYTADVSGVCSALYEMGGMTVMHDASGCNSTYNTHDEPRWYDVPSLVFISALAEVEALMGDEEKLIGDVCRAAEGLRPRFIALAGTPIPMMMGTDFKGIARVIEERTGIPTFGFATNGMNSYNVGAGMALAAVARRFCDPGLTPPPLAGGRTPLCQSAWRDAARLFRARRPLSRRSRDIKNFPRWQARGCVCRAHRPLFRRSRDIKNFPRRQAN